MITSSGNNTREWLMQCLAGDVLSWPKHHQMRFLDIWENGRKRTTRFSALPPKGKRAADELRWYINVEAARAEYQAEQQLIEDERERSLGRQSLEHLRKLTA